MSSFRPKLDLRVSQKQILTPGLVQMVSVLALNKLELRDMINAEMVENPVLEELDGTVPLLDEVAGREESRLAAPAEAPANEPAAEKKDPFEEIDFGSFFQDYLDPGYRSQSELESIEKPSFENFLSRPSTLTDHLMWQLGAIHVSDEVYEAAEMVIGDLDEDGYLTATEDELMAAASRPEPVHIGFNGNGTAEAAKHAEAATPAPAPVSDLMMEAFQREMDRLDAVAAAQAGLGEAAPVQQAILEEAPPVLEEPVPDAEPAATVEPPVPAYEPTTPPSFSREALREAIELVRQMDPVGVASRDLRECLLAQLRYHQNLNEEQDDDPVIAQLISDCMAMVSDHLHAIQNKQFREIGRALGRPIEAVQQAMDFIRTLDPKPGLRYNKVEPRLIEPDVAFIKQGDDYVVVLNDDDVPQLRLNPAYRHLLKREAAEKDVRVYVKERYKSAIQLIKNIEQRKQTILKVCYAIVGRQREFLDRGIDQLKPMMIKEVAEEIGVHPSTVSRAVANKYGHTPQGVFELRYFFSESVNGPEGGSTSLLILKRRVKKLIEEEDSSRPLTDEQITRILQSQGIQVTRRTVAKYREDMKIPSTHQRRVKK
jgi:RNA polymerase sigma-54 factor